MNSSSLRGLILAGGAATRMGSPKALLVVDGSPAVLRVAGAYRAVGIEPLVVLGHEADRIAPRLEESGVPYVVNERHAEGMYSSVRCGVRALTAGTRAFFVHPVDCVLVRPETLALLARSPGAGRALVSPLFERGRGHPPLLPAALRGPVLTGAPAGGLGELLAACELAADDVSVDDPHVLDDMDDPADFGKVQECAPRERLPGRRECLDLLARHRAPAAAVAHAQAVTAVAGWLGEALRAAGVCLDLELLEAAARTHDLARGTSGHAHAGAALLDGEGYPRVASVVRRHMDLAGAVPVEPGESEVLFLADKLTIGAEIVGLERKEERAAGLFAGDAAALAGARRRLADARGVAGRIEDLTGRPVAAILAGRPGAGGDGTGTGPGGS